MKKLIVSIIFFIQCIFSYSQELKFKLVQIDENLVVVDLIPIVKKNKKKKEIKRKKYYVVKKGENLISIAYNNQIDWRVLKEINKLDNITDIYPGQTIKLSYQKGGKNEG